MQKSLLAALAISPGNKAITKIDEKQYLIVERHWCPTQYYYSASVVDMKQGDVTHATGMRTGPADLQEWLDAVSWYIKAGVDLMETRWMCLEEEMMCMRSKTDDL